jgi:hypothetical protein
VFYGEAGEEVSHHVFDLKPREWAVVIPLLVMMVWMGVYSQSFLPPVGKTTARVLEQTQVNVPFRVQLPDFVGQVGNLRPIGNRPAVGSTHKAGQGPAPEVASAR